MKSPSSSQVGPASRPLPAELEQVEQALVAELGPSAQITEGFNRSEVRVEGNLYVLENLPIVGTTVAMAPSPESWDHGPASVWLRRLEMAAYLISDGCAPEEAVAMADLDLRLGPDSAARQALYEGREFP